MDKIRFRWTRYFSIKKGAPTGFANGKFPCGIDLSRPDIPIETVKAIYESGNGILEPTSIAINKWYPRLKKKKADTKK